MSGISITDIFLSYNNYTYVQIIMRMCQMLNKYGWIILYVSDYLFLLGEKKIHLTLYYGITGKSRDTKLERFLPKNQHTQLLSPA